MPSRPRTRAAARSRATAVARALARLLLPALGAWLVGCGGGAKAEPPPPPITATTISVLYQTVTNPDYDAVPAIVSLGGAGPDDAWATGQFGTAVHFAGGQWTLVPTGATGSLSSVSVPGASSAFVLDVLYGIAYQWNGAAWAPAGEGSDRRAAIWAESAQSLWSVGTIEEHWDGQTWTPIPSQYASRLGAVSAVDPTSLFAVGSNGGAAHLDGGQWIALPTATTMSLNGVWAEGPSDAWMAGGEGALLHWNGTAVTAAASGTRHELTSVSGTGPRDIWVGGKLGTLLHWDGSSWSLVTTSTSADINAVWAHRPGEVWTADVTGQITSYVL